MDRLSEPKSDENLYKRAPFPMELKNEMIYNYKNNIYMLCIQQAAAYILIKS